MEVEAKTDHDLDAVELSNDLHQNLKVANKRTLFKSHKNCFIAKDAVEYM